MNGEYDNTEKYAQAKINEAEIDKSLSAIAEKMKAKGKRFRRQLAMVLKKVSMRFQRLLMEWKI